MQRLPNLTREQLKPEDQKYYDSIVSTRSGIRGPFGVLLHSPDLAARVANTGAFARFTLDIPESLREIIIMATTREQDTQYAFTAHARLARDAKVPESTIKAIADRTAPKGLSGDEALAVQYTLELLRNHKIIDATFNAVKKRFGDQKMVEITALIGHFMFVSQVLNAFQVELAPGVKPELPL